MQFDELWDSVSNYQVANNWNKYTYQTTIFHKLQEINSMMTDYPANPPITAGQTEPVQVSNNNYQYTDSRIIEVELLLGGIKDELSKYSLFVIQS